MRCLIFAEDYLPNIGGIASHVHQLALALQRTGSEVHVMTVRKLPQGRNLRVCRSREIDRDGLPVTEIPVIYSPRNILLPFQKKFIFSKHARSYIKKNNVDVFHWHNIYFDPDIASHANGLTSMVFTNHSSQFLAASTQGETERAQLFNTLNYAHQIIAPSEQLLESTFDLGYPRNRGSYIPNGVDTDKFSPNEGVRQKMRKQLNIQPHETVILCARRIVQKCGIVYFAKALRRLQNTQDLVVLLTGFSGSLTWRDHHYESLVLKELEHLPPGIRVVKLGHVPSDDMPSYYRAADLSILPSLVEATSIAGLESMASGVPLIGTNVGGIPAIIQDKVDGLLVPSEDPHALEKAIRIMIDAPDKRRAMGDRAREATISRFSWDIISRKTAEIYERAAEEFKLSGPVKF